VHKKETEMNNQIISTDTNKHMNEVFRKMMDINAPLLRGHYLQLTVNRSGKWAIGVYNKGGALIRILRSNSTKIYGK
jgi:hypothetical protein